MLYSSRRSPLLVYFFTFSMATFRYSMFAAVNPLLIICQKYPEAEKVMSVYPLTTAEITMSVIVSHIYLLYTRPYIKYSDVTTIRLVMFFSTVTVATPRSLSAQNDVRIIPTNIKFAGYHTFTIFQLNGSTLMYPVVLNTWTSTTATAHWKNRRASVALKENEDSAALFSSVMPPLARQKHAPANSVCCGMPPPAPPTTTLPPAPPLPPTPPPRTALSGFI
mmetsp:Transcript_1662/g.5551  ORF Transcript_1662/g.5551 Transcript_1662/m.5551 type:complete len:221 (+) Transcript_1662:1425-2087(+)